MGSRTIKYIIDSILELLYSKDETCIICKASAEEEAFICSDCRKKVKFYNESFKIINENLELACYSSAYYTGIVVELIKKLKYYSSFESGKLLADFLVELITLKNINFDLLTFVPMHKKALKKRGFNQSEYLAKLVGERLNKPVVNCLKKVLNTEDQIGLNGSLRWKNVSNCFEVIKDKAIINKKILLVDDVITTGATTFHCSLELVKKGAEQVSILTVAKSKL